MKTQVLILALLLSVSFAFYDEDSSVVTLTAANFQEKVIDSDEFWLVEFYAPWCGHCKKLTPEWERAAKGLKGIVSMGAVDMTTEGDAGKAYDVQGYPTLKFFGEDKDAPQEYEGGRTSVGIINFATRKLKEIANTRIGNKKRAKPEKKEEPKPEEPKQEEQDNSEDQVIVITDSNFETEVEESKEAWFIEFYAPWCGHCKNLTPTWKKLAANLKGQVNIAKVDATENNEIAKRFGVNGYPSLKFFPGGPKSDSLVEDYSGARDIDALEQWASEKAALSLPAKFSQLVDQATYEEYCANIRGVCIIAFLPHLIDSSVEDRKRHIQYISEVADDFRGKPFTFLWSEGGKQFEFENTFNVGGSGYPHLLAVTVKKGKHATMLGAFNKENISSFVQKINSGRQSFSSFNTKPVVKTIDAWNGEDIVREERKDDL